MASFYADENFPLPADIELRRRGHDVLTISQSGHANRGLSDPEVLKEAASQNRALLTLNRKHFIHLHEQSNNHAGIFVCTMDRDFLGLAHRIHRTAERIPTFAGKLVRINRPSQ